MAGSKKIIHTNPREQANLNKLEAMEDVILKVREQLRLGQTIENLI